MSLIKCNECGKEISDKAHNCIHCGGPIVIDEIKMICSECGRQIKNDLDVCNYCGCPIGDVDKSNNQNITKSINIIKNEDALEDEYTINKTIIDSKRIDNTKRILLVIAILLLVIVFLVFIPLAIKKVGGYYIYGTYYPERTVFNFEILLCPLLIMSPIFLMVFAFSKSLERYKKNNLTLTNKRIIGSIYELGNEMHIDIPINKINAITSTKSFGNINGISISSAFYKTYHLSYIINSEEFRKNAIKLIGENNE